MSRDDDNMGWSGADKSPLVVVQPRQEGNSAATATRTAGSLILILFMLAAVVLAVLAITMHTIYESDVASERSSNDPSRQIVLYRNALDDARRATPMLPAPTLETRHPQVGLDRIRADNATLRKDNQDRIAAAARQRNVREPRCPGLPGVPNPNCRRG